VPDPDADQRTLLQDKMDQTAAMMRDLFKEEL